MTNDKTNHETACLAVSVGQEYHEGEKLKVVVERINAQYRHVIIDVADTLQRHNLALERGLSLTEAHTETRRLGDEWLDRNRNVLNTFTIPVRIDRWDSRLNHPDYEQTRQVFDLLYQNDQKFRKAVGKDARGYIHRRIRRGWNVPKEKAIIACTNYLLEEIAALTLFYRENPCVTVYPAPPLRCFELVKKGEIEGAPKGLENEGYEQIQFVPRPFNDNSPAHYVNHAHRAFCLDFLCR